MMNDASTELVLENSDSLEITYEDGKADFFLYLSDYLVSLEGTGVFKATCDFVQRSCTVEDDHASYTLKFGTGMAEYDRCFFTGTGPGFFQLTDDGIEVRALVSQIELHSGMKGIELEVPQGEHFLLRPHDDGTAEITVLEEP